jgi:hypothetical protein
VRDGVVGMKRMQSWANVNPINRRDECSGWKLRIYTQFGANTFKFFLFVGRYFITVWIQSGC